MRDSSPRKGVSTTTRRTMLQQTSAAVAASTLASLNVPLVHAGQDSTIQLALVGCGSRGTGAVADAFSTSGGPVKLVAMADLFDDRLQASRSNLASSFPDKVDVPPDRQFLGFDAYKKAIDCLRPGDVALLTTHAAFRPMMFEYAVRKGVNVFMEKSFAVDPVQTRRLLAAAEDAQKQNLKVGVGFMWRHSQARQETIQRIQDGAIGDLHTLRIYRVHGPTHCPPLPKGENEIAFQIRHAFSFNWLCSGFLIDWHCHNIDVACWTKGAWPVSAQAFGGRTYPEAGNLFDHYTVEFTFADGAKLYSFSRHMDGCWETYADYAHGTKGCAVLMANLADPGGKIYKGQDFAKPNLLWEYGAKEQNPYHVEWQELLDAIRHDRPYNEAIRAAEANFTALMGRAAAHGGQFVTIDEVKASNFTYGQNVDTMTFETTAPIQADSQGLYAAPVPGLSKEV